ncbi:MAG: NUDIX domain-containing protein [Microbacterium sp.]
MTDSRDQEPRVDAEEWDVIDAEGAPTGRTHRRGDAGWPEGGYHLIAAVCVARDDGRVLLTQRAEGKDFGLDWEFPGGSAFSGETSAGAASRELREETGIAVGPDRLAHVGRFTEASALLDLYAARVADDVVVVPDPSEVADAAWVALADVSRRIGDGSMAQPWIARLAELWEPLAAELARGRTPDDGPRVRESGRSEAPRRSPRPSSR